MKNLQLKISITLFALGLLGIFSFLATPLPPGTLPKEVSEKFSTDALPFLILINPTIFLIVAIVIGGFLTSKVQLDAPLIRNIFLKENIRKLFFDQLKFGVALGAVAGILITLFSMIASSFLSQEFLELENKFSPSPLTRFLYGGITEELLLRWGFMTLIVWLLWKLLPKKDHPINQYYWIAIIISSILFGAGHLPITFSLIKNPSIFLIIYIISANSIFGVFAGWLFWRKGIEAAIFSHMIVHVVFLMVGLLK